MYIMVVDGKSLDALEVKAIALAKQYKYFLPNPVKAFLLELANFLEWAQLEKELK